MNIERRSFHPELVIVPTGEKITELIETHYTGISHHPYRSEQHYDVWWKGQVYFFTFSQKEAVDIFDRIRNSKKI